eukprot:2922904-Alexandrium_andersonii.AAC.1
MVRPENIAQADYFFLGTNGEHAAQAGDAKATLLSMARAGSGLRAATMVLRKGKQGRFGILQGARFLDDIGC